MVVVNLTFAGVYIAVTALAAWFSGTAHGQAVGGPLFIAVAMLLQAEHIAWKERQARLSRE